MKKLGLTEIGQVGEERYQGERVPLIGFSREKTGLPAALPFGRGKTS